MSYGYTNINCGQDQLRISIETRNLWTDVNLYRWTIWNQLCQHDVAKEKIRVFNHTAIVYQDSYVECNHAKDDSYLLNVAALKSSYHSFDQDIDTLLWFLEMTLVDSYYDRNEFPKLSKCVTRTDEEALQQVSADKYNDELTKKMYHFISQRW